MDGVINAIAEVGGLVITGCNGNGEYSFQPNPQCFDKAFSDYSALGKEVVIKDAGRRLLANVFGPMISFGYQEVAYGQTNSTVRKLLGWGDTYRIGCFLRTDTVDDGEVFVVISTDGIIYVVNQ